MWRAAQLCHVPIPFTSRSYSGNTHRFNAICLTFHFNHCFSQSGQSLKTQEARKRNAPGREKQTNPQTGAGIHSIDTFSNVFSVIITPKDAFFPVFDVLKPQKERGPLEVVKISIWKHRKVFPLLRYPACVNNLDTDSLILINFKNEKGWVKS